MTAVRPVGVDPYNQYILQTSGVGMAAVNRNTLSAVAAAGSIATGQSVQIPGAATAGGGAQQEGASGEQSLGGAVGGGVIDGFSRPISAIIDTVTDPKKLLIAGGLAALSIAFPIVGIALLVYGLYSGVKDMLNGGKDIVHGIANGNMSQVRAGVANIVSGGIEAALSAFGFKAKIKADFKNAERVGSLVAKGQRVVMVGKKYITNAENITVRDALWLQGRQLLHDGRNLMDKGGKFEWRQLASNPLKQNANGTSTAQGMLDNAKGSAKEMAQTGTRRAMYRQDSVWTNLRKAEREAAEKLKKADEAGKAAAEDSYKQAKLARKSRQREIDAEIKTFTDKQERVIGEISKKAEDIPDLQRRAAQGDTEAQAALKNLEAEIGDLQKSIDPKHLSTLLKEEAGTVKTTLQGLETRANQLRNSVLGWDHLPVRGNTIKEAIESNKTRLSQIETQLAAVQPPKFHNRAWHTMNAFREANPGVAPGLAASLMTHNQFAGSYEEKRRRGQV